MKTVKLNSPKDTPIKEIMFVIQETGIVNRIKMRKIDVEKRIEQIDDTIMKNATEKEELLDIKSKMDILLK